MPWRGRGAHLANATMAGTCTLHWWRDGNHEVDFVVEAGRQVTVIEVKSGRARLTHRDTTAFVEAFQPERTLLVGGDGIDLEDFLTEPFRHWLAGAG